MGVAFAAAWRSAPLNPHTLSKQPISLVLQRNRMKKNGGGLLSNNAIGVYINAWLWLDWTFAAGLSHEGIQWHCAEFNSSFENRLCFESRARWHLVLDKISPVLTGPT